MAQYRRLVAFFDAMNGPAGEWLHAWSTYETATDLVRRVSLNVLDYLHGILEEQEAKAVQDHVPVASKPADDGSDEGWFKPEGQPVHLYVADAISDGHEGPHVVACIVVNDLPVLERQWQETIARMREDPLARTTLTSLNAIERQRLQYGDIDPEERRLIARALRPLAFEAYVSFTRVDAEASRYSALMRGVVFDRFQHYRSLTVVVSIQVDDLQRRATATAAVEASIRDVRARYTEAKEWTPTIVQTAPLATGGVLSRCVAAIVRVRLARDRAAIEFDAIHPQKLRVLLDVDSGRHYTRRDPYPA